jgi:hypothetical protein
LEIRLQVLAVGPPRLAVDASGGVSPEGEVGRPQALDVVDVVQERSEHHLFVGGWDSVFRVRLVDGTVEWTLPLSGAESLD